MKKISKIFQRNQHLYMQRLNYRFVLESRIMKSKISRSLTKTVTWRLIATLTTFIASYIITGSIKLAGSIIGIEATAKIFLYYAHERG